MTQLMSIRSGSCWVMKVFFPLKRQQCVIAIKEENAEFAFTHRIYEGLVPVCIELCLRNTSIEFILCSMLFLQRCL